MVTTTVKIYLSKLCSWIIIALRLSIGELKRLRRSKINFHNKRSDTDVHLLYLVDQEHGNQWHQNYVLHLPEGLDDWSMSAGLQWFNSGFLHKKGSRRKCENYRTISLISHTSKVFLRTLKRLLESYGCRQIPKQQAGFIRGGDTREQILNIR